MLYELLLLATGFLVTVSLGILLENIIKCHLTYVSFKRKTRGLPMIHDRRLVGNHLSTWLLRKNLCRDLLKAHTDLGFSKTIGAIFNDTSAVCTVDLDLIKLIAHDETEKHVDRFDMNLPFYEYEQSIIQAKGDDWRKIRRAFAPALKSNKFKHPNVVQEIERSIEKLVNMIDAKLDERAKVSSEGHTFVIDDIIHRYTLDLVFSCFYKQPNLVNFDDKRCRWTELVDEGLWAIQSNPFVKVGILFPATTRLIDWCILNFHSQGAWRKSIASFVMQQAKLGAEARKQVKLLEKRRQAGEELNTDNFLLDDGTKFSRNMIDHIVDQYLEGKLTKSEYLNNSCFLVGSADKTSADCLANTLYQLGRNQDIQGRLRKSVEAAGSESEYLDWVFKESLRLKPPAPLGCTRTITRDIEIEGGYLLPKGSMVVTCSYVIHRLKKYWGEDADEFKPERWADTSKHHPMQYIPFGAGPRGCPGKEFALFEMKKVLSALITRYKFECGPKEDLDQFDSPGLIFTIPNSPFRITFKKLHS